MCLDIQPWTVEVAWRKLCHDHDDFNHFLLSNGSDEVRERLHSEWQPPTQDFLKLNVDGSYTEDGNRMGAGGVLKDTKGNWVQGFMTHDTGGNSFIAKAIALRNGLAFAWNKGVRKLLCETDCQELTQALTDTTRVMCHDHSMVLYEIKELIERQWQVLVSWVPREANAVAD